uniref:Uncharacterized protein n=1 Tax=Tetraselmis sp. GSL018 TaxID=582737 RepID=A0A061SAY8_9CHLO|mmetsp:Transcript_15707/g.37308  ORF Transcript_15707/g.37308 Transcript_15707/m.37308 type:complete len:223 (+) Transcript_15707:207-875(+)
MEIVHLQQLQTFRESEGLQASRLFQNICVCTSHPRTKPALFSCDQPVDNRPTDSRSEELSHKTPFFSEKGVQIQDSSYVVDNSWRMHLVSSISNSGGCWGVGGASRIGVRSWNSTLTNEFKISVPSRLDNVCCKFELGQPRHQSDSLALVTHLKQPRRSGGGRGWVPSSWFRSERDTFTEVDESTCNEQASAAVDMAKTAIQHQWRLNSPPPLPRPTPPWFP